MKLFSFLMVTAVLLSPSMAEFTAIYFGATSCQPCQKLKPALRRLQQHFGKGIVPERDESKSVDRQAFKQFGIASIPTIIFFDDGKEIDRIIGAGNNWESRSAERLSGRNNWRPMRATVRIKTKTGNVFGKGTGTIIRSVAGNTIVLTCAHVVASQETITVEQFQDREIIEHTATVDAINTDTDLALLKITTNTYPLPVVRGRDSSTVRVSDVVYTIGCSEGQRPTLGTTRVQSLDTEGNMICNDFPALGRSGGGVFNLRFEQVGVCSGRGAEERFGVYVASSQVIEMLDKWEPTNYRTGSMGIGIGLGVGVTTAGRCNNPNCPNCRTPPRPFPQTTIGRTGPQGPPGKTGAQGLNGRDSSPADLSDLLSRIKRLEGYKRRVILVNGKTGKIFEGGDKSYGIDEPIILDIQPFTKNN